MYLNLLERVVLKRVALALFRVIRYMWKNKTVRVVVSEKVYASRVIACKVDCNSYIACTGQCGVCKCFVREKAKLITEDCPNPEKNYWK